MVITRKEGVSDLHHMIPLLARTPSDLAGAPQGLGVAWSLVIAWAGWILQGIGMGMSTYQAVRSAKENMPPDALDPSDVRAIAQQVAVADPQHRSVQQWEQILGGVLVPQPVVSPVITPCPPGFYRDPVSAACMPLQKAGFEMPTWGWIAVGVGGYLVLKQTGIIKV